MPTDEWYTTQDVVDMAIKILSPAANSIIMCPFDTDKSLFVKTLKEAGHTVIYSVRDFVGSKHYEFDYVVTNPPFSIKDNVIETVFAYGKRTVLVLPLDSLSGLKRRRLYQNHEFPQIYMPSRRYSYMDENYVKRSGSNFASIIMTLNHGAKSEITWELINA